jgi:hypothetical protein
MTSDQQKVMDVVFLIDATGSMSATIKAAHDKAAEMAINLRVKNPDVNFMFGSVCYRDPVDSPGDTHEVHQLNPDIDTLVSFFATVHATGGGDGPEDWVGAYRLVLDAIKWRDGPKTIIHIADAPAHGKLYCGSQNHEEESPKLKPLIQTVAKRGILMSCIDINCGASASFDVCKSIYEKAGGCKFSIEKSALGGGYGESSSGISASFAKKRSCKSHHLSRERESSSLKKRKRSAVHEDEEETLGDTADCDGGGRDEDIGRILCDCTEVACEDALELFYA